MAALDFQDDELEELLVYEDLFLEYFNAFLALPAFPVRLFYDRLTGDVQELDGLLQDRPQEYAPSEQQRERTMSWLRHWRQLLFKRSPLYLEYKLAKLLLRPLAEPHPLSRYGIRGYSRQSNSAALSTIPSNPSTAGQLLNASDTQPEALVCLDPRMPSRTRSCPAAPGYLSESYNLSLMKRYKDVMLTLCSPFPSCGEMDVSDSGIEPLMENDDKSLESQDTERQTIPHIMPADPETMRAGAKTMREDGAADWANREDADTTAEEESFLQQHNLTWSSLQQLKEEALGTREGVRHFIDFLQNTLGFYLLHFWMDCEEFRECSADFEATHSLDARHLCVQLFRSIQGKYQLYLSAECQEEIRMSQQNWGTTFHALRKPQYDALRRLRSYWIPRFLIHQLRYGTDVRHQQESSLVASDSLILINGSSWIHCASREHKSVLKRAEHMNPLIDRFSPNGTQSDSSRTACSHQLFHEMLPALQGDREAGGIFLRYLKRFEDPQKTQTFLLWQELDDSKELRLDHIDCTCAQHHVAGYMDDISLHPISSHSADLRSDPAAHLKAPALRGFCMESQPQSDLRAAGRMMLGALCEPYVRFLRHDITSFLEYCVPTSYNETEELESRGSSPVQAELARITNPRVHVGLGYQEGNRTLRRKTKHFVLRNQVPQFVQEKDPRDFLELLQHKSIYNVYRKAVQGMGEPEQLQALELLHALDNLKTERKILDLVQSVLELDSIQTPHMKGLRKRLADELSRGRIGRPCLEEMAIFLSSLLVESFDKYWKDVMERLKDYGVEEPTNEHWTRLEPILQVITTKMVMKHQHARKGTYPVQVKPNDEDLATFHQAVRVAAEGWPTVEILHFLHYLQVHGPTHELPLLENNLLCYMEVQKYRNVHHPMPDKGLLKRKVRVIRDRFLALHANPGLQLSQELLESILRDVEDGMHAEVPYVSIFDRLQEELNNSLLPFWAAFRRAWQARSPASAQRAPVLKVQQMLRKHLALFQAEENPPKTFHLPPVQSSPEKKPPSLLTYSFSMSHGVSLKNGSAQSRASKTPPVGSQKMSPECKLTPITGLSQERIHTLITSN